MVEVVPGNRIPLGVVARRDRVAGDRPGHHGHPAQAERGEDLVAQEGVVGPAGHPFDDPLEDAVAQVRIGELRTGRRGEKAVVPDGVVHRRARGRPIVIEELIVQRQSRGMVRYSAHGRIGGASLAGCQRRILEVVVGGRVEVHLALLHQQHQPRAGDRFRNRRQRVHRRRRRGDLPLLIGPAESFLPDDPPVANCRDGHRGNFALGHDPANRGSDRIERVRPRLDRGG